MPRYRPICNLFLLLIAAIQGYGQNHYVYTRFTRDNGLASTDVHSVYQDRRGFLWIGTSNGLNLYDGARFHHYAGRGTGQLAAVSVYQVLEDKDAQLWVNTGREVGVFNSATLAFRTAAIKTLRPLPKDFQLKLWTDSKGHLILIVTGFGVFIYDKASHSFTPEGVPFQLPESYKPYSVIEDSRTGNYWLTADSGLVLYDPRKKEVFYKDHNPGRLALFTEFNKAAIVNFFIDSRRRYWIASWTKTGSQHLHLYDSAANRVTEEKPIVNLNASGYFEYSQFTEQKNGTLWLSGSGSFFRMDPRDQRFYNNRNRDLGSQGIMYEMVNHVIEDKEENLWIATDKGLYVLTSVSQHVLNYAFNETDDIDVNAVVQLDGSTTLLGTWGAGIFSVDSSFTPVKDAFYKADDMEMSMIWDLCLRKGTDQVWAACQRGRIAIYDKPHQRRLFLHPALFGNSTIRQTEEDHDGRIWFGTHSGKLIKYAGIKTYPGEDDFTLVKDLHVVINHLYVDKRGLLWISTNGDGIYVIDPASEAVVHHFLQNSEPGRSLYNNSIVCVQQINDSIFVAGFDALDIINVRTGQIKVFTPQNGLPFSRVKTMRADGRGSLWITGTDEIYRYNYARDNFTAYGKNEGFANADAVGDVSYLTRDGRILFGGANNFLVFDPDKMSIKDKQPDVTIGWFYLMGKFLPMDSLQRLKEVTLNYDQNSFIIYFSTASFLHRNKLTYYYKLDGVDKDWVDAEKFLGSNYSLIPPGHYTFQVRSVNDEGVGSVGVSRMDLYIRWPWWRTWWFLTAAAACVAGLVYYIYRMKINKLVAVQRVRAKVARDLHDDVGATLTTIGILSEMARMKTNGNAAVRELIDKIGDNSARMMESMDDIVWSINPQNDSMQRIAARMREYAVTLLEARNIDYNFQVQPDIIHLHLDMETRRDLFLIFKESVNNLVKYSKCGLADIRIYKENGMLKMKVQDDGIGFDIQRCRKGNGHNNMRKRAGRMNAAVTIQSDTGSGTTILLEIPLR